MSALSRGVILEGVSCSGKTSTMYALKRLFSVDLQLERNIIMLGEHYTQVLNLINGEYKHHEHSEHTEMLCKRIEMIEQLYEWACYLGDSGRKSRGLYTVFERGLINHTAFYKDFASPQMKEMEKRFEKLGMETILLIMSDEFIEKRIYSRAGQMKISYSDSHFTKQAEEAKMHQDNLLYAVNESNLPYRIILTDAMDWDEYARVIVYGK